MLAAMASVSMTASARIAPARRPAPSAGAPVVSDGSAPVVSAAVAPAAPAVGAVTTGMLTPRSNHVRQRDGGRPR